jgi:hypothetical protein
MQSRPRVSRAASGRRGIAPHPSICLVHKDAWNRRFVVSILKFSLRRAVTTIVNKLQEMEALSEHGNPRLSTLVAVTKAIGLRLTVEAAQ